LVKKSLGPGFALPSGGKFPDLKMVLDLQASLKEAEGVWTEGPHARTRGEAATLDTFLNATWYKALSGAFTSTLRELPRAYQTEP
jgi:hypothetical protein